jgi:hypothetical protein
MPGAPAQPEEAPTHSVTDAVSVPYCPTGRLLPSTPAAAAGASQAAVTVCHCPFQAPRTFWPMPTITPVWRGLPTMLGKTARGASSPANPACKAGPEQLDCVLGHACGPAGAAERMVERRPDASQRTGHAPPAAPTLTMPDPLSQTSAATDPSSSIAIAAPVKAGAGVSGQAEGQGLPQASAGRMLSSGMH